MDTSSVAATKNCAHSCAHLQSFPLKGGLCPHPPFRSSFHPSLSPFFTPSLPLYYLPLLLSPEAALPSPFPPFPREGGKLPCELCHMVVFLECLFKLKHSILEFSCLSQRMKHHSCIISYCSLM